MLRLQALDGEKPVAMELREFLAAEVLSGKSSERYAEGARPPSRQKYIFSARAGLRFPLR